MNYYLNNNLNFIDLKNSAFLHLAKSRYSYKDSFNFIQKATPAFDTTFIRKFTRDEYNNFEENTNKGGWYGKTLTLVHLKKALELSDSKFLNFQFKKEITRQWMEVTDIVERLDKSPVSSMLVISQPGDIIPKHCHYKKQTLTFCYKFDNDKLDSFDNSCIIVGPENNETQVNFDNSHKVYFTFLDNLAHGIKSNEWRFFWLNDFDEYVTIPKESEINFTYLHI